MKKGETYHLIGGAFDTSDTYFRFIKKYHEDRAKKGINVQILYSRSGRKWADEIDHLPYTEIKFIEDEFVTSTFILVYHDNTLLAVPSKEDTVYFLIKNAAVAESFRSQFNVLWNRDTFVRKGLDAVQETFEEMLASGNCDLIGARGYFIDKRPNFIDDWERRAKKQGFTQRNIVDPGVKGHRVTKFPFAETKYTLPKAFADLSVFWIFGDKVVISNWQEDEPILFVMNDKKMFDLYKKQFETLWNQ